MEIFDKSISNNPRNIDFDGFSIVTVCETLFHRLFIIHHTMKILMIYSQDIRK